MSSINHFLFPFSFRLERECAAAHSFPLSNAVAVPANASLPIPSDLNHLVRLSLIWLVKREEKNHKQHVCLKQFLLFSFFFCFHAKILCIYSIPFRSYTINLNLVHLFIEKENVNLVTGNKGPIPILKLTMRKQKHIIFHSMKKEADGIMSSRRISRLFLNFQLYNKIKIKMRNTADSMNFLFPSNIREQKSIN